MGQNCVAGTTEIDEEEGIGLVLYVNSESNLIVWKMSDGTKQENTVPLTTEYQSMLKSEFENKTGVTIGFIIIHRYTEETIDIESSITINSGDTPTQTQTAIMINPNTYVFGILHEDNNTCALYITTHDTSNKSIVLAGNGGVTGLSGPELNESFINYLSQIMSNNGYSLTGVFSIENSTLQVGDFIPNWDNYQKYQE